VGTEAVNPPQATLTSAGAQLREAGGGLTGGERRGAVGGEGVGRAKPGPPEPAGEIHHGLVRCPCLERGGAHLEHELRGVFRGAADREAERLGPRDEAREHHLGRLEGGLLHVPEGEELRVERVHRDQPRDVQEALDEQLPLPAGVDGRRGPQVEEVSDQRMPHLWRSDGHVLGHLDPVAVDIGVELVLSEDAQASGADQPALVDERGTGRARGGEQHVHVEAQLRQGVVEVVEGATGSGVGGRGAPDEQRPVEELDVSACGGRRLDGEVLGEAPRELRPELAGDP